MSYNAGSGLSGMLREGSRHYSQEDDSSNASVVIRNIEACLQLSRMLSSSVGPQGRCKLVVNHLQKTIVTSDCASILKEVDVIHPAAQLLKQAVEKQQEEYGDNTAFVLAFGGELLYQTAKLIQKMTWQPAPEILSGYQQALELIETQYVSKLIAGTINSNNENELLQLIKPIIASKQYGSEDILAPLITEACLSVMDPITNKMNVDAIRTVKIMGSSVNQSMLLNGYCALSGVESVIQYYNKKENGKSVNVCVYACGFEASSTEAKGTVLMKNADELMNYNKTEEIKMSDIVASIKAANVDVIVVGGNISDMALHYIDQNHIMCLKISSKWELRRLCQAVHATALVRLGPPTLEELGYCETVSVRRIGNKTVTIFQHDNNNDIKLSNTTALNTTGEGGESTTKTGATSSRDQRQLATIVLRASTMSVLNDLERAVDDGVQAIAQVMKHNEYVYGGGAFEMSLSTLLQYHANSIPGLEQYAVTAFGKALEVIPRTLADNAGWDATRILADMQAAHSSTILENNMKKKNVDNHDDNIDYTICDIGVDIDGLLLDTKDKTLHNVNGTASMEKKMIVDLLSTKMSALRLAVDAVITILKIDQIIMSKPSGGPNPGK